MTDQELDELEARLPVIVETLASLRMDISLEAWNYISNNILSSAKALSELRVKNAALAEVAKALIDAKTFTEFAVFVRTYKPKALAALQDKENTQ